MVVRPEAYDGWFGDRKTGGGAGGGAKDRVT